MVNFRETLKRVVLIKIQSKFSQRLQFRNIPILNFLIDNLIWYKICGRSHDTTLIEDSETRLQTLLDSLAEESEE